MDDAEVFIPIDRVDNVLKCGGLELTNHFVSN